ncbi:hypothetical protein DID88_007548 [Monilinia fructigena]|uniref:Uncharacterized protein n=1 Tax=Monilinia fructigena TaxID=38457 RepID=A0A395J2N4_9HELO|nr:hypothetical protein DID88_007548 [Monilinia fructigena]
MMSSTIGMVKPTKYLAYPDLKIGIPNLLLFKYPSSPDGGLQPIGPKQGGPLGLMAFADAMNPWDLVKAFARSMRWLFVGVKHREADASYKQASYNNDNDMSLQSANSEGETSFKARDDGLPIANGYRSNTFGSTKGAMEGYTSAAQRYTPQRLDVSTNGMQYANPPGPPRCQQSHPGSMRRQENPIGVSVSGEPESYLSQVARPISPYGVRQLSEPELFLEQKRAKRAAEKAARDRADQEERERSARPSEQWANSRVPVQPPDEPPRAMFITNYGDHRRNHPLR